MGGGWRRERERERGERRGGEEGKEGVWTRNKSGVGGVVEGESGVVGEWERGRRRGELGEWGFGEGGGVGDLGEGERGRGGEGEGGEGEGGEGEGGEGEGEGEGVVGGVYREGGVFGRGGGVYAYSL